MKAAAGEIEAWGFPFLIQFDWEISMGKVPLLVGF
jgi:hypothetical protein